MARRCSRCGLSWPNFLEYSRCAKCGERTSLIANEKPMSLKEATSLKNHLEFEREYDKWEAKRQGPSPGTEGQAGGGSDP